MSNIIERKEKLGEVEWKRRLNAALADRKNALEQLNDVRTELGLEPVTGRRTSTRKLKGNIARLKKRYLQK